ncbi:MAG: AI-2E family transporter [Clostridia bacterium]|nr:AI-2E family transporter [Clostridia bacterium]
MNYISILKKSILIVLVILLIYFTAKLFIFYMPFLIAYIISIIIEPIIKFIARKTNLSRKVSSIIVLATIFIFLALILIYGSFTLVSETTNLLSGLNTYLEKSIIFIQDIFSKIDLNKLNVSKEFTNITEGTITNFLNIITNFIKNVLTNFLKYITSIPTMVIYIIITILSTYFITSDKFYLLDFLEFHLSKKMMGKLKIHIKEITKSLGGYLKAELIIIFISFIIVLIGLNIFYFIGMNIKYPTLIALGIGFVDALPILRIWNSNASMGNNTSN